MRMKTRRNRQRINDNVTTISPINNNTTKKRFLMICTTTVIVVIVGCFHIIGYDGTILSTGTINFNEISQQQQQQSSSSTSTASTSSSSSSLRNNDNGISTSSSSSSTASSSSSSLLDYEVSQECKQLPFIRPMGSYFLNNNIQMASSPEGVEPSFNVGSNFGNKVTYHMGGDKPHFQLIKELLSSSKSKSNNNNGERGGLVLDMGANQGFFTWYLATLGMDVHAFEIFEKNVIALQHGAEFNPPDVSARVHLYPVGLGQSIGRMGISGSDYDGHLKKTTSTSTGPILSTSIDCFVYHNLKHIGNDLINNIAFVKLDVEGYEIDVLLGGSKSIFGPNNNRNIGGMLMEVGPKRWNRGSNITFQRGVETMKDLSTKFDNSYIIVRTSGRHAKTCPPTFASQLNDQNPRLLDGVKIHKVTYDEWESLLQILYDNNGDCNFWYTN